MLVCTSWVMTGCEFGSSSDTSTYLINTSGGIGGSDGGIGGSAGNFKVGDYDTPQNISITTTGTVTIDFTPSAPAGIIGTNPLDITSNMIISVQSTEPATDTPYFVQGNPYIYISNGDGNLADEGSKVTGIKVNSGKTLTLAFNFTGEGNGAIFNLSHDFINNGTITLVESTEEDRGMAYWKSSSFVNRGTIALQGTKDGQHGGALIVECMYGIFNFGPINTYGSDNVDGNAGDGGFVDFYSEGAGVQNLGNIYGYGGIATGTTGNGGDSSGLALRCGDNGGTVFNGGTINCYGGSGIVNGGDGATDLGVHEGSERGIHFVAFAGGVLNTGTINTYGGAGGTGTAGAGGNVTFSPSYFGDIKSIGNINTYGGSTADDDGNANFGGNITVSNWDNEMGKPEKTTETKEFGFNIYEIAIAGNLNTSGGNVPADGTGSGGKGGDIYVNGYTNVTFVNYGKISGKGGNGNTAGTGADTYFCTNQNLFMNVPFDLQGGAGTTDESDGSAIGGNGGDIVAYTHGGTLENLGWINLSGGANINDVGVIINNEEVSTGGHGGEVDFNCYGSEGQIFNGGNITSLGGNDIGFEVDGTIGWGGNGGKVNMYCGEGGITNHGEINCSGGDGSYRGGHGGRKIIDAAPAGPPFDIPPFELPPIFKAKNGHEYIYLYGATFVDCPAAIIANGGNAVPTHVGSIGGNGSGVEIKTSSGGATVTYGPIIALGGTGETPGYHHDIIVGGVKIQHSNVPTSP